MQLRYFGMAALSAVLLLSTQAFGQAQDGYFQIRYATTGAGDTFVNMTNTGANINGAFPVTFAAGGLVASQLAGQNRVFGTGYICVNAYVFDATEEEIECCSCNMSPNSLWSWSVLNDLVSNPGNGAGANAAINGTGGVTVKLIATLSPGPSTATTNSCDPTKAGRPLDVTNLTAAQITALSYNTVLSNGLLAWARGNGTETAFSGGTLSMSDQRLNINGYPIFAPQSELTRDTSLCAFNSVNGSGPGVCKACSLGAR